MSEFEKSDILSAVFDNDVTLLKGILQQSNWSDEITSTRTRALAEAAERDHVECLLWLSSYTASVKYV